MESRAFAAATVLVAASSRAASKPSFKSKKGRELDPRHFDAQEFEAFIEADATQWKKHLDLGAVKIIPPEQAKHIRVHTKGMNNTYFLQPPARHGGVAVPLAAPVQTEPQAPGQPRVGDMVECLYEGDRQWYAAHVVN